MGANISLPSHRKKRRNIITATCFVRIKVLIMLKILISSEGLKGNYENSRFTLERYSCSN